MRKIKWLGLQTKLSIDDIAERLTKSAYTHERSEGFVLEQRRRDFISARFVERLHRVEEVIDPFGNPETFERYEYRSHEFGVFNYGPGLEFVDPSRGSQTLVARLLEIMDFDLAIAPLSIDIQSWAMNIQTLLGTDGVVDRVQAKNLQISGEALASVEIDAKSDAVGAFRKFVAVADASLQKLRVRLPAGAGGFTVTSQGVLEVAGKEKLAIVEAGRRAMFSMEARYSADPA
ncbi:hypothetical protein [Rhizobium binae]|uniref:hypothetical protein n=1 Tax=Rhizobium binae TaxID=1138190 RepID=UPI001C838BEB|nr:hypothetical protein [Rhizobium binae]MBX4961372.1 hypothetical protein [Rhizobium binae]